ncbi:MAG: MarR family transcriptional regulator [Lachnospiraceae bacterium]|nr:MarR family transcriptional regulator [Lachnospiraceae bacterium]
MSENKTNKFDCLKLSNQLCFPLYAASRKIVATYTPHLKPLNLTYTQYLVFLVLWETDDITVSEICSKLHLDNGTVSPLIKKLESRGLLKRERSSKDERVVTVKLTKEGKDLKKEAVKIPEKIGACVDLSPEEAGFLYSILYKLID